MRRHPALRPALPLASLLAMALLSLAGCAAPAGGIQRHHLDHGQTGQEATGAPAIVPQSGVVEMRVEQPGPTDVEFQWKPTNLVASPGQTVTLEIANNDYMQHNFLFQVAKVNRNLPVGKVTTVRFTAPAAGTYAFWCKYHLQMMKGSITVR